MTLIQRFSPHEDIARALLPRLQTANDAAHDVSHLLRVWKNVQDISAHEGGDARVLVAATLLHDCVHVEKDAPVRSQASRLAAAEARKRLNQMGWKARDIEAVAHAIEAHSFSAQIAPVTLDAKILQDADRLDAIGYAGIARCFYVSGRLGRSLYDPEDPMATDRPLDDLHFALDHFQTKLLKLKGSFQTETAERMAKARHQVVEAFLQGLVDEAM